MNPTAKFFISLIVWFSPLLILLVIKDCGSLPELNASLFSLMPVIDRAAAANIYPCATRVAWIYCWATFPFVLAWLLWCCRDIYLGRTDTYKGGGISFILFIIFISMSLYGPFMPYDPEYRGVSWQGVYSRSIAGMLMVTWVIWLGTYALGLATIQWLLWLIRR